MPEAEYEEEDESEDEDEEDEDVDDADEDEDDEVDGEDEEEDEEEDGDGAAYYTVRPGDSLSAIAQRELGDASRWGEIYELNRETIGGNPNLIQPGQELELPE